MKLLGFSAWTVARSCAVDSVCLGRGTRTQGLAQGLAKAADRQVCGGGRQGPGVAAAPLPGSERGHSTTRCPSCSAA